MERHDINLSSGGDGKAASHDHLVLSAREEEEKSVKGRRADEESSERKVCAFEFAPATPSLNSDLQTPSLNSDLQSRDQTRSCK